MQGRAEDQTSEDWWNGLMNDPAGTIGLQSEPVVLTTLTLDGWTFGREIPSPTPFDFPVY